MKTIFPNLDYEDFITLFNNLSKFIYYTIALSKDEISISKYNMKLRYLIFNRRCSNVIISTLSPSEYKNLTDDSLCIKLLSTDKIDIHLIFDDNAEYKEPVVYTISKLFSDSKFNIVILADDTVIKSSEEYGGYLTYVIEYLEKIILAIFNALSDSKEIALKMSKICIHLLFYLQDEWMNDYYRDLISKCIEHKHTEPLSFSIEDEELIDCITKICIPDIVN